MPTRAASPRRRPLRPVTLAAAALLAGTALAVPPPASRAQAPAASSVPPLPTPTVVQLDARLQELSFSGSVVDPPMSTARVRVLLPTDYATSGLNYPVLWLLHGAGDTAAAWTENADGQTPLEIFTAPFTGTKGVVIVMPDGGANDSAGWYSDWFNEGRQGPPRWETFHLEQLVPYIEQHYRVRHDRGGRIVAGLSMGGFGAMSYAARHPDMFSAAFAFSGFVDTDRLPYLEPTGLAAVHSHFGTPTKDVWGTWSNQEVRWRAHNPADLVGNLRGVRLWFTTGMGLPGGPAPDDASPGNLATEAAVFATNASFDIALTQAGVPHTFIPYPQGGHDWWHWQDDLHRAWPLIEADFATPSTAPAAFDYQAIDPAFSVWGWDVAARRPVTEFLRMTGVDDHGLTLSGSGRVDLVTPPDYVPGSTHRVTVAGRTASTPDPVVVADSAGRLHLTVVLGPGHTLQEDTNRQRVAAASDPNYWETATVAISR